MSQSYAILLVATKHGIHKTIVSYPSALVAGLSLGETMEKILHLSQESYAKTKTEGNLVGIELPEDSFELTE